MDPRGLFSLVVGDVVRVEEESGEDDDTVPDEFYSSDEPDAVLGDGGGPPPPGVPGFRLLVDALKAIRNALADRDCAALFNTDPSRPHTWGPGIVIEAMVLGIGLAGAQFGVVRSESISLAASAVTLPGPDKVPISGPAAGTTPVQASRADIILQANPLGDQWTKHSPEKLASLLLHELGHVFNIVKTLGGSKLKYDANPDGSPNKEAQEYNAKLLENCKPRL